MRLSELRRCMERQPFRPFRICVSDGTEHEVTDPNLIYLTKSTVCVYDWEHEDDELPELSRLLDFMHITRVDVLDQMP